MGYGHCRWKSLLVTTLKMMPMYEGACADVHAAYRGKSKLRSNGLIDNSATKLLMKLFEWWRPWALRDEDPLSTSHPAPGPRVEVVATAIHHHGCDFSVSTSMLVRW